MEEKELNKWKNINEANNFISYNIFLKRPKLLNSITKMKN